MDLEITSGAATVIASGQVTSFGGQPLRFGLKVDEDLTFQVELVFASDPALGDVAVRPEHLDDGLRFHLVNFDGADGRGSAVPVLLGELGEHLWFMHFRVFRYGRTEDHTVHYSFYKARKADVGWRPA